MATEGFGGPEEGRYRAVMALPIHRRSYECEVFEEGDGRLRVRGRLVDTKPLGLGVADGEPLAIHDMAIDLIVSYPEFTIVGVETAMNVHPYDVCTDILTDYQQLVGLSITRGYSRKVRDLFGGPGGCSHIGALLQALGPVAIQASWSVASLHQDPIQRLEGADDPEERARRLRLNRDTCHVWADGGEHMTAVELGEAPPRPHWEADRLEQLGLDLDSADPS